MPGARFENECRRRCLRARVDGQRCANSRNNDDRQRDAHESPTLGERYIAVMTLVIVTPKANGPLVIEGPVRIVTPDGRELTPPPRKDGRPAEVVVLCRCGGSAAKPVCDGSPKREGVSDGLAGAGTPRLGGPILLFW